MAVQTEVEAIKSTLELPGRWPTKGEWEPIQADEADALTKTLYPRIVKLLKGDEAELKDLYHPGGFWRDLVCLTWTFRTFQSKE